MLNELNGSIYPGDDGWPSFLNFMRSCCSPFEVSKITNIYDACNLLMEKKEIDFGRYTLLSYIFEKMKRPKLCDILENKY